MKVKTNVPHVVGLDTRRNNAQATIVEARARSIGDKTGHGSHIQ